MLTLLYSLTSLPPLLVRGDRSSFHFAFEAGIFPKVVSLKCLIHFTLPSIQMQQRIFDGNKKIHFYSFISVSEIIFPNILLNDFCFVNFFSSLLSFFLIVLSRIKINERMIEMRHQQKAARLH